MSFATEQNVSYPIVDFIVNPAIIPRSPNRQIGNSVAIDISGGDSEAKQIRLVIMFFLQHDRFWLLHRLRLRPLLPSRMMQ